MEGLTVMHDSAHQTLRWSENIHERLQLGVASVKQPACTPDVNLQDISFKVLKLSVLDKIQEIQDLVSQYLYANNTWSLATEFPHFKEDLFSIMQAEFFKVDFTLVTVSFLRE